MTATQTRYLLPFDEVMQEIEQGFGQLSPALRYQINAKEYVWHLLEWLSVRLEDQEATSALDPAATYLKTFGVPDDFAQVMSHAIMNHIFELVALTFVQITFREMSSARYVLDSPLTLSVYIKSQGAP